MIFIICGLGKFYVSEGKNSSDSSISIMVENDQGSYSKSQNNDWPSDGYIIDDTQTKCRNGGTITWNEKTRSINATINEDDKCSIYFNKSAGVEIIKSNPQNLNADQAGMYRFQGSKEEVNNNYICFGTYDQKECLDAQDKYMYRILGITSDGLIKVIKSTPLKGQYPYNADASKKVDWPDTDLYKGLMGAYFLKNLEYDYLQSDSWLEKIADYDWLYGAISVHPRVEDCKNAFQMELGQMESTWKEKVDNNRKGENGVVCTNSNYGQEVCYIERNGIWNDIIRTKIGLIYSYDYYFSVDKGGYNCNFGPARNYLGGVVDPKCANAWLNYDNSNEHVITQIGYWEGGNQYNSWFLKNGVIDNNSVVNSHMTRPVFYIKTSTVEGSGTIETPYLIKSV